MQRYRVYLGLGSNLGNRPAHLRAGLAALRRSGLELRAVSSLYLTEPDLGPTTPGIEDVGSEGAATDHPWYVNCVAAVEAAIEAADLLSLCLEVERRQGRERGSAGDADAARRPNATIAAPRQAAIATTREATTAAPREAAIVTAAEAADAAPPQPRTLDVDILLIGGTIVEEEALIVPHPRLSQRRFVLDPLAEIAPSVRHPVVGATIAELRDELRNAEGVWLLAPPPTGLG